MATKAERTKQFILEKAAPIFNAKGIEGTNIDDVLAATKLTKGSIYSHFVNKEDLALQTTDYLLKKISTATFQAISKGKTAREKIHAYLDFNKDPLNTYFEGGCPLFNSAVEADDNQAVVKQQVAGIFRNTKDTLTKVLVNGIRDGELSKALDAASFAFKLFAAVEGATVMCRVMNDIKPMRDLIRNFKAELDSYSMQ
ncbi:MAG TPA: TetR/AcrR family transcriptional regulator [Puia sp.]|nr:TetR/AcrR family transcriptional regulator [Puia sp.]